MLARIVSWTLAAVSIALALPAMVLMFASEKIGDLSDEWLE